MGVIWTQEEDNFLIKEFYNKTIKEISILLNRSCRGVEHRARRLNIKKISKWSTEEDNILKNNYGQIHTKEILKLLPGRNLISIKNRIVKLKLKGNYHISHEHERFYVQEDFFEKPSIISSYYAGLLAADGHITPNLCKFSLSQVDKDVILKFIKTIDYQGNIKSWTTKTNDKKCYRVVIASRKLVQDLYINYNLIPKKSLKLQPPKNLDYINSLSFIIGLIDGDGYIGIFERKERNKSLTINLTLTGTKEICEWVKSVLEYGKIYKRKTKSNNTYLYTVAAKQARIIIYKLREIKELEKYRLKRKWDKILEWEQSQKEVA